MGGGGSEGDRSEKIQTSRSCPIPEQFSKLVILDRECVNGKMVSTQVSNGKVGGSNPARWPSQTKM